MSSACPKLKCIFKHNSLRAKVTFLTIKKPLTKALGQTQLVTPKNVFLCT